MGYVHGKINKLYTQYLVSLAPRDNNYLIQNNSQNNFAQVSKERGRHIGAQHQAPDTYAAHTRTTGTGYHIKKKPRSLTRLVLDSFVPSARVMDREKMGRVRFYCPKNSHRKL